MELAKQIADRRQTVQVLAGILTFSDKVIDEAYRERIKEEMQMTQVGQMIFEDGFEQGTRTGIQALVETCRDLGGTKQDAMSRIIQMFSLSEERAQAYLDEFWK